MTTRIFVWALGAALTLTAVGEENSAQRLENAQQGMAAGSWPRKPDNRLSPLSGKMKEAVTVSPALYRQEKKFEQIRIEDWDQRSSLDEGKTWRAPESRVRPDVRWDRAAVSEEAVEENDRFLFQASAIPVESRRYRELDREKAGDWAARPSRFGQTKDGTVIKYEGRLTRVRERVAEDNPSPRELGPGRQEQFTPGEVEKILSRPPAEILGNFRERSGEASQPEVAGN